MSTTTDPARTKRDTTTGNTRGPAQPVPHNGDGERGTPCAARSGRSSPSAHALRLLGLARRAEQAQGTEPAAAREAADWTPGTPVPAPQPPTPAGAPQPVPASSGEQQLAATGTPSTRAPAGGREATP